MAQLIRHKHPLLIAAIPLWALMLALSGHACNGTGLEVVVYVFKHLYLSVPVLQTYSFTKWLKVGLGAEMQ